MNRQSFSRIHHLFGEFTMNLFGVSRIDYRFTIFIANLVRIHLMFPEFTMNSVRISRIYYDFTIYHADSLWIHYFFRESSCFRSLYHGFSKNWLGFREFTKHSFPISRIRCLFCENTMNSLSVSQIHYKFSVFFVNI